MNDQETVELLALVWASIDEVCSDLDEDQWKAMTECPGWSVQDNVAHVSGVESAMLGRSAPEHTLPADLRHVKNDIGRINEVWVDSRRPWSGAEVLEEFREVTDERLTQLRAMTGDDFGAASWTPVGPGTVRDLLPFRIFDSWCHEQDIRRAVGIEGDLDGPVAASSIGRSVDAMPYVVGKKVKPGDGVSVLFDVTGPVTRPFAVTVEGGRAKLLEPLPADPSATLRMDAQTFHRVATGRCDQATALAAGQVELAGDTALARRVLDAMNYLF